MNKVPPLKLDMRYVGESIVSISQDIQFLLPGGCCYDVNVMQKVKHAKGLVENIISVLTFLNLIESKLLDIHEELSNEVRKIEFSCFGLQSILSQGLMNAVILQKYEKKIRKFIKVVNTSANRIITISFLAKSTPFDSGNDECSKENSYNEEKSRNDYVLRNEINAIDKEDVSVRDNARCEHKGDNLFYKTEVNKDEEITKFTEYMDKYKGRSNYDVSVNEASSIGIGDVCYRDEATCEMNCDGICFEDVDKNNEIFPKYSECIDTIQERSNYDMYLNEINIIGSEDVCYKDKATCELHCDGACYENGHEINEEIPKCPEYKETFTESTLTQVESGYDELEQDYWRKPTEENSYVNGNLITGINESEEKTNTAYDDVLLESSIYAGVKHVTDIVVEECESKTENNSDNAMEINEYSSSVLEDLISTPAFENEVIKKSGNSDSSPDYNDNFHNEENPGLGSFVANNTMKSIDYMTEMINGENNKTDTYEPSMEDFETNYVPDTSTTMDNNLLLSDGPITNYENTSNNEVPTSLNEYESTTESFLTDNYESTIEPPTTAGFCDTYDATTSNYETSIDYTETTTIPYDTHSKTTDTYTPVYETNAPEYKTTTPEYETTAPEYETTTPAYETTSPEYETTTSAHETTTEDLYKVSQDIYSAAQDLSTKANEISSMTSDISSKISNINSMVSDLNSYDDDELSKKVQSVSKITQEISSKTSEISSLCSTTSSLASDISSASSDMPSADRHHRFKTSPWQKMSAKCQEMVTACQSIVTTAQDILLKMESIVSSTVDLKVAEAVSTSAYEVTAKTQMVMSETLNIVSAVIELMNVIES